MVNRDQLIKYIEYEAIGPEMMKLALQKDDFLNGVQFLGGEEVSKIALGVSLNEEFLKKSSEWGSNFCIFHHGMGISTHRGRVPMYLQKRMKIIFNKSLTVMGFHHALDAHKEIGNNATIIRELGARIKDSLFDGWGYTTEFDDHQDLVDLEKKCKDLFNHDVFSVKTGPRKIKVIGVVSGAGKPHSHELAEIEEKGVELFISGETSEHIPSMMAESEINYFAGGHYATEVFGVKELGKKIKEKFENQIEVEFIDVPNPI